MLLDLTKPVTHDQFAAVIGISRPAVSELVSRGTLIGGHGVGDWLVAYCANLRELAAGRDGELAAERARLAREQADRIAMQNAVTRKELAPVGLITEALARTSAEIVAILESLPVQLKRQSTISLADLEFITDAIVRARNIAAAIEINLTDLEDAGNPERDQRRAEAA